MPEESNRSEISFISSLSFLTLSLSIIFTVMFIYQPSKDVVGGVNVDFATNNKRPRASRAETRRAVTSSNRSVNYDWPDESKGGVNFNNSERKAPQSVAVEKKGPALEDSQVHDLLADAMRLVDNGDPQKAMSILKQVLDSDPKNEMALVEMGMIYLIDLKDSAGAAPFLERALQSNPNNSVVLSELVGIYDEIGQTQQGSQFLQKLYEEHPDNTQLALGLGQVMVAQDKVQEALPYLERAAEDSSNPTAITEFADALSESGQPDRALDGYKRVLDIEKERSTNGFYDNQPGIAVEKVALARMDLIGEYLQQKNMEKAETELARLREEVKDDEHVAALLDQFKARKGGIR